MSWREKAEKIRKRPSCELTEPPKDPFVSFGGEQNGTFRKKRDPAPLVQVTCETCQHFVPDPINPPAGGGSCAVGAGDESIGPSLHPMAPRFCKVYVERTTDEPERRLKEIARKHGIDWKLAREWLADDDIAAAVPYLDAADAGDEAEARGLVCWLRLLADPTITKIPPKRTTQ